MVRKRVRLDEPFRRLPVHHAFIDPNKATFLCDSTRPYNAESVYVLAMIADLLQPARISIISTKKMFILHKDKMPGNELMHRRRLKMLKQSCHATAPSFLQIIFRLGYSGFL
jgi:hypothetical protein